MTRVLPDQSLHWPKPQLTRGSTEWIPRGARSLWRAPRSFSGGFLVAKWRVWRQVEGLYPLHKSLSPPLV